MTKFGRLHPGDFLLKHSIFGLKLNDDFDDHCLFFLFCCTNLQSLDTLQYGILSIIQVVVVAGLRLCHLEKNVQIKNFFNSLLSVLKIYVVFESFFFW
jgi:hypothetical protein